MLFEIVFICVIIGVCVSRVKKRQAERQQNIPQQGRPASSGGPAMSGGPMPSGGPMMQGGPMPSNGPMMQGGPMPSNGPMAHGGPMAQNRPAASGRHAQQNRQTAGKAARKAGHEQAVQDGNTTTAYLMQKAEEDAREHAREKVEEQKRLYETRGGLAVAERYLLGDMIPQGKRCVICGYCGAENLIPAQPRTKYCCYFCREALQGK